MFGRGYPRAPPLLYESLFRDPQALSSSLAALRSLQLRPSGSLKAVEPLVLVSNYNLLYC